MIRHGLPAVRLLLRGEFGEYVLVVFSIRISLILMSLLFFIECRAGNYIYSRLPSSQDSRREAGFAH